MSLGTDWLRENWATYFSNVTARRDFRTQLRGSKPILLWSIYLIVLMAFGIIVYAGMSALTQASLAQVQYLLSGFSGTIMGLLSTSILLIAPALTAGTVAGERQRKSLDLVLSTPMELKHYLVGKLVSSYRYTWMLLLLALPLVSMCVVIGGATWVDVVSSFIYLSLYGLLFTAIGLHCSVLAPKPVSAIVYSYIAVFVYTFLVKNLDQVVLVSGATVGSGDSWVTSLDPLMSSFRSQMSTHIFGIEIPNWVPVGLYVICACKILLLGAGSAMSRFGSPETKSLRLHSILYVVVLAALVMIAGATTMSTTILPTRAMAISVPLSGPAGPLPFDSRLAAIFLCYLAISIHWLVPFMACFSPMAERKFSKPGLFSIKTIFNGEPSGALPFLLLLILAAAATLVTIATIRSSTVDLWILGDGAIWASGFLIFVWSLSRFASSSNRTLTTARGVAMLLIASVMLLPLPVIAVLSARGVTPNYANLHPMYAGLGMGGDMKKAGLILAGIGAIIALGAQWNDSRLRRRQLIET